MRSDVPRDQGCVCLFVFYRQQRLYLSTSVRGVHLPLSDVSPRGGAMERRPADAQNPGRCRSYRATGRRSRVRPLEVVVCASRAVLGLANMRVSASWRGRVALTRSSLCLDAEVREHVLRGGVLFVLLSYVTVCCCRAAA